MSSTLSAVLTTDTRQGLQRIPSENLGVRLAHVASEFFDLPPGRIFSRHKHGEVTAARRSVTHVLMTDIGWSSLRVADLFGQKHPSILSARDAARELIRTDPVFFEAVERLREEVFCGS